MPQVKIKQGTKSSINNNTGVLNAGTLAVTTDTNELFFTHNDGTLHQLCDNVGDSDKLDGKHLSEIVNGTTNYIPKFTGANSVGDSIIYATTDKVGIGTSNPSEKFEVVGNIETDHIKLNNSVTFLDNSAEKGGMRYNIINKTIEFFFI